MIPLILEITPFYIGLFLFFGIYLSMNVIKLRRKYKIGVGNGGNEDLARAVRVHGNFIEQVPLALIGLAMIEAQQLHFVFVHLLGLLFFFARIMHARGLAESAGKTKGRFIGMVITFGVQAIIGLALVLNFIHLAYNEFKGL
jgi:uncharacterized protein